MRITTLAVLLWVVVIVFSLLSPQAQADGPDLSLNLLIGSEHFDSGEYNEDNPGLGIAMHLPNGATYGVLRYLNSHSNMSTLIHVGGNYYTGETLKLGVMGGFVTGYDEDQLSTPVIAGLTASVGITDTVSIFAFGIPGEVVGYGLNWNF